MNRFLTVALLVFILPGCTALERMGLRYGATEEIKQQPPLIKQASREVQKIVRATGNAPAIEAAEVYGDVIERASDVESLDDGVPAVTPDVNNLPAVEAIQDSAAAAAGRRPTAGEKATAGIESARDWTGLGFGLADEILGLLATFGIGGAIGWRVTAKNAKVKVDGALDTAASETWRADRIEQSIKEIVRAVEAAKSKATNGELAGLLKALGESTSDDTKLFVDSLRRSTVVPNGVLIAADGTIKE